MRWQIVGVLVVVVLCALSASSADKVKDDLKKLQGEWQIIAVEMGGRSIGGQNANNKLVFDGDKLTIFEKRVNVDSISYSIKLDPSAAPKTADLTFLDDGLKGQVLLAVYELQDNELWLCVAGVTKPRPEGLSTIPRDPGRKLFKCKRPKKPDAATAKEMKKLDGTWAVAALEIRGKRMPQRTVERLKYVFSDGKWSGTFDGQESEIKYTYELENIKADPKMIDLQMIVKDGRVTKLKGIYKLDGDELTICYDNDPPGRPTAFETKPNSLTTLVILKRQKP